MMYPEMMHIVVNSHHEYLRSLARGDSIMNDARNLVHLLRNALGRGMVSTGRWVEGHAAASITLGPAASLQDPS